MQECTTTKLSKTLSLCLGHILQALRYKDDISLAETGVRRYFVVNSYDEVAGFLRKWKRTPYKKQHRLYTGDFSTMYTTIPHEDLIQKINIGLQEAWEWKMQQLKCDNASNLVLRLNKDRTCTWEKLNISRRSSDYMQLEKGTTIITLNSLKNTIEFMIKNVYVSNGGIIKRQKIGIPMGTNCAPNMVN